ncbi:MAG TPA: hypothetical protein VN931_08660 [Fibrobacteria bacterium]|nr:hypothetical protein [Fibrobacteria bacterium]
MQAPRISIGLFLALGSLAMAIETSESDALNNASPDTSDQPYTYSATTPEDTLPVWSLDLLYSGSRSPNAPLRNEWTTEATRAWHLGGWEPSASVGWSNAELGARDSTLWHLGSGVEKALSETWSTGAAFDWSPATRHKGDAAARAGIEGSRTVARHWDIGGSFSGGWDRLDRGRAELGAYVAPDFGWTRGRVGTAWNRALPADSGGSGPRSYAGNLGLSIQWAFLWGSWSTGPTWCGDRWRSNASDRVFLWNLGWRPLSGVAFSVDLFRSSGGEVLQPMEGATPVQAVAWTRWTTPTTAPAGSKGGRATISVSW